MIEDLRLLRTVLTSKLLQVKSTRFLNFVNKYETVLVVEIDVMSVFNHSVKCLFKLQIDISTPCNNGL